MINIKAASYFEQTISMFQGNPFISTLPQEKTPEQIVKDLTYCPEYYPEDRNSPLPHRLELCQQIDHFFQPGRNALDVAYKLDKCLRWGYVNRNPLEPTTIEALNALAEGKCIPYSPRIPSTHGFTLLGISGSGKTRTIERVLELYPQVIRHTAYHGIPLCKEQVVWLKFNCAPDGSLKGLCRNFMMEMDKVLGTTYLEKYDHHRFSVDQLMTAFCRIVTAHSVGVLVIDELQHLCGSGKKVSPIILNFFVSLVNQVGIPVITCGTGKAMELFRNDFQQARRASGSGEVFFTRMNADSEWERFMKRMWNYQYTQNIVSYTDEMKEVFFEVSLGIPFIAVHLYRLVQEDAIITNKDTFSVADIRRISCEKMLLTKKVRDAISSGKDVDLYNALDISPMDYYSNNRFESEMKPIPTDMIPTVVKETNIDKAVTFLADIVMEDRSKVRKFVNMAAANHESPVEYQILFREAYALYNNEKTSKPIPPKDPFNGASCYEELVELGLINEKVGA